VYTILDRGRTRQFVTPIGNSAITVTLDQGKRPRPYSSNIWRELVNGKLFTVIVVLFAFLTLATTPSAAWLVRDYQITSCSLNIGDAFQAVTQIGELDTYGASTIYPGFSAYRRYGNAQFEIFVPSDQPTLVISNMDAQRYMNRLMLQWGWEYWGGGVSHEDDNNYS
jgi:hypothetical protein